MQELRPAGISLAPGKPSRAALAWIGVIFIMGAVLRFVGLGYGLPNLYMTDEEFFVRPALRVADGNLNPNWFGAPAQPLIYGLAAEFKAINWWLNLGSMPEMTVAERYRDDPTPFQTAGRALAALAGSWSVVLAWLLGRRVSESTGLTTAGLVAGSFYLVEHSHIIRPDVIQTLFILCVLFATIKLIETRRLRWSIGLGVTFGLAITTKYPSLILAVPLGALAVLGVRRWHWGWKPVVTAVLSAIAVTVLSAPFLFLTPKKAFADIRYEGTADHGAHSFLGFFGNIRAFGEALDYQIGTLLIVVTLWAWFWWWRERRDKPWSPAAKLVGALVVTALFYLMALSFLRSNWDRWAIPAFTIMYVAVGAAMAWLARRIKWKLIVGLLTAAAILAPSIRLVQAMWGYVHPHTADIVRAWIVANVPVGSGLVLEPKSPVLPEAYPQLNVLNLAQRTASEYAAGQWRYAILNEGVYGRIINLKLAGRNATIEKIRLKYDEILRDGEQLLKVVPSRAGTISNIHTVNDFAVIRTWTLALSRGPTFWVYRFRWSPTE